jgi:signal transduction histidine kinase
MVEQTDRSQLFMSTVSPGRREKRLAVVLLAVSALLFVTLAPFASVQLPRVWAFIPVYQSAIVIDDLVTAVLLFGQFSILRSRSLLVLAGGYLFTAMMAAAHTLSFPGLFSPTGLLGAQEQTTAWLYMFWHGGFPLTVIGYTFVRSHDGDGESEHTRHAAAPVLVCIVSAFAATAAFFVLATVGHDLLPPIMSGSVTRSSIRIVVTIVWGLNLLALAALWHKRPHSILDLWVMLVLAVWVFDIALSALLNHGRFDLGFYAGRIYGLVASGGVLFALLLENGKLYASTVRALEGERRERKRVQEKTVELNEAKALLEDRVAARTSELQTSNEMLRREVSERERAEQALEKSREELCEVSAISSDAREAEKRRIARELHDELAQALAMLKIDLGWLAEHLPRDDGSRASRILGMQGVLDAAVASTRRIASDLRPLMLDDLGFVAATQALVEGFEQRYRIACTLRIVPADLDLPEPYATTAFRIMQESLANIARHAHALHVEIDVTCSESELELVIRDDGVGFDLTRPRKRNSFGLVGLRERAYLVRGRLDLESAPGNGTTIRIAIPLPPGVASSKKVPVHPRQNCV